MKHPSSRGVVVVAVAIFVAQLAAASAAFSFPTTRSHRIDVRGGALAPTDEAARNPRTTAQLNAADPSLPSPRTMSMEHQPAPNGRTLESPSADRNKGPIWEVLESNVFDNAPPGARSWNILEIAAGAGVHTQYFGHQMMNAGIPFRWQSSDPDPQALASQQAYMDDAPSLLRAHLLHPLPLTLDSTGIVEVATTMVLKDGPPLDLIVCINMIHIAPWSATKGLMRLAGQRLRSGGDGHNVGGVLYLYGPYRVKGACVTSNERFDAALRANDPSHGIRNLEDVVALASEAGLVLDKVVDMPANNLSLLFRKV